MAPRNPFNRPLRARKAPDAKQETPEQLERRRRIGKGAPPDRRKRLEEAEAPDQGAQEIEEAPDEKPDDLESDQPEQEQEQERTLDDALLG